jgi:hypothetical protein
MDRQWSLVHDEPLGNESDQLVRRDRIADHESVICSPRSGCGVPTTFALAGRRAQAHVLGLTGTDPLAAGLFQVGSGPADDPVRGAVPIGQVASPRSAVARRQQRWTNSCARAISCAPTGSRTR